jgi:hypothetical protein
MGIYKEMGKKTNKNRILNAFSSPVRSAISHPKTSPFFRESLKSLAERRLFVFAPASESYGRPTAPS